MPKDDNTSSTSHPVNLVTKTTPYLSSHYPHAYVSHYSIVPCPVSLFPITRTLADVQQQEKGVLPSASPGFPRGTVLHYEREDWLLCVPDASTIVLYLAATLAAYTYEDIPSLEQNGGRDGLQVGGRVRWVGG